MNRNKILSLILSFVMIGGLISAAPVSVHASEINNTEVIQQSNNLYDLDESINNNDGSQEIKIREKRGVKGKIAKTALKKAAKAFRSNGLRSTLNGLKHIGFSTASINNMVKYSGKIASVLDNLSTWSYVVEQAIYDQIAGALGGGTVARDVAWWVSKIVSWGLL
ncbi:hypothetical protein N072000002_p10190 (plasmid) [Clostridium tetani]|uniref:Uncharacterized protein n=1 Tax=Clostridium tetani TaxID=1513 RepID=A0A4Q0V9H9_CLOTA|nr:hypothetical protein [Clostridium tetani]RXI41358.1 hypothetical protein DP129_01265 [Clostridium tetani]RXI43911.1 hypothetical protein DP130_13850 [Clostridium tetani]BDR68536.1 hypothetical protein K144312032_p10260 [Clostridium tetani]BDR82460.1 hypothetical protein K234311028_p10190 [Clostridium tetani]BDR90850.1 hypothetical protein N072000002_p10190 [Clostridium tetani]